MKKVLFTATVDGHISHFHMKYIKWFQEKGYIVHVASNGSDELEGVDKKFNVPFERSPFNTDGWEAYRVLKTILQEHDYDIIHCHTPMGATLTRLAARQLRKEGTKLLYTAHGFHFYKGSPALNWMLYYPVEKLLARYTDCLITINPEDFQTAHRKKFKTRDIRYVHGVGVDMNIFHPVTEEVKKDLRIKHNLAEDATILSVVGELSYRKNPEMAIEAMNSIIKEVPKAKLLIAGMGEDEHLLKQKVKEYALEEAVKFLGFRQDVDEIMQLTDVALSCSRQEGLPVNVMEAMATGLPLIVTNCRGNRDLVYSYMNGYVIEVDDVEALTKYVVELSENDEIRKRFGRRSLRMIKNYSESENQKEMNLIYQFYINSVLQKEKELKDAPLLKEEPFPTDMNRHPLSK